jgi:hypothetical protein
LPDGRPGHADEVAGLAGEEAAVGARVRHPGKGAPRAPRGQVSA